MEDPKNPVIFNNFEDHDSINKAVRRFFELVGGPEGPAGSEAGMSLRMDLAAANGVNGNRPIDWQKLLAFDDFNFIHDVGGISRHMDRDTGKLGGFFLPRCAR